jgi:8-hydroxy-5-deazaflavin:NADPH oxidoreductase
MKIGMIGGGSVGQTLAKALLDRGHDVVIGIREVSAESLGKARMNGTSLADWQTATGGKVVTMAQAAAHGEVIFNVTSGIVSLAALAMVNPADLADKVFVDVANPLDFSQGMPPFLAAAYSGPTSLAEQIQAAYPAARVVKAFNTVSALAMVDAAYVPGLHDLLIAGNDTAAKAVVRDIATGFGWSSIVDLGDIVGARAMEGVLPLWVRLWMLGGDPRVNIRLVRP